MSNLPVPCRIAELVNPFNFNYDDLLMIILQFVAQPGKKFTRLPVFNKSLKKRGCTVATS